MVQRSRASEVLEDDTGHRECLTFYIISTYRSFQCWVVDWRIPAREISGRFVERRRGPHISHVWMVGRLLSHNIKTYC
jgi:hypothetical protein